MNEKQGEKWQKTDKWQKQGKLGELGQKGVKRRAIRKTEDNRHTHTHTENLGAKRSKLSVNKELQQCLATFQLPCRKCKDGMIE